MPLGGKRTPHRTRSITTGIAGIAAAVGLSMGQGLMQVGGYEPPFDAAAVEIQMFFEARSSSLFAVGSYLQALSLIVFLWFLAGVSALLKEAEGEGPWRANLALVSGVVVVATTILGSWELAVFRADEGLDPQLGRLVFDLGNLSFASAWVALGSVSLASGWVMVSARSVPRWLGWWGHRSRRRPRCGPSGLDDPALADPIRSVLDLGSGRVGAPYWGPSDRQTAMIAGRRVPVWRTRRFGGPSCDTA